MEYGRTSLFNRPSRSMAFFSVDMSNHSRGLHGWPRIPRRSAQMPLDGACGRMSSRRSPQAAALHHTADRTSLKGRKRTAVPRGQQPLSQLRQNEIKHITSPRHCDTSNQHFCAKQEKHTNNNSSNYNNHGRHTGEGCAHRLQRQQQQTSTTPRTPQTPESV